MVGGDPRDAVQCFPPCGPGIDRSGLSRDFASLRHWLNPSMANSAILIRADRIPPGSLRARFTRQIARKDEGRINMTGKIAHFPTARTSTASTSPPSPRSIRGRSASLPRAVL
jgi:hypothetical protein